MEDKDAEYIAMYNNSNSISMEDKDAEYSYV